MKIDRILAGIRESQAAEKQASEAPPAVSTAEKTAATHSTLISALNEALSTEGKTAAVAEGTSATTSPLADVMKVAQELAGAEKEAAVKEAQLLGAAFADAAVARMAEWNKTASQMGVTRDTSNTDFQSFAQTNPDLVKQAAQLGYDTAKADLEKQAEASYVQGYNDTVDTIHKTAALEFLKAAAVTAQLIQSAR
jgi:hypothetical protein